MRVNPVTEEEAKSQTESIALWPKGVYDYEVREATEKTSSTGNEMIELEVWIFNTSGGRRLVFDYLVSTDKTAYKIRHFCESCGMLRQYETGDLIASEIVGRSGKCHVDIRPAKDGYEAKNTIRDYIKASQPSSSSRPSTRNKVPADDLADEIPF